MSNTKKKAGKGNGKLNFVGQILDNVHGFIPYTEAERDIMKTELFSRLQGIKQLSVVNWVFPGSEHTRYIHSLGVMHIADKMAVTLGLTNRERRILRLAGLLHDIGHYPLSHVGETPYLRDIGPEPQADAKAFCAAINQEVVDKIDGFEIRPKRDLMKKSTKLHHEAIGGAILLHNKQIHDILVKELGDKAPGIIFDIITGRVERTSVTDPLLVQIMHSELDADGIDYIMRDSASAGTSFGACEIDQLIRCLTIGKYKNHRILCVKPKGIPAADQYIINKFFHYSQVVFNRHIVVSEWMAEQVINWMRLTNEIFPDDRTLLSWAGKGGGGGYLAFHDNQFWTALDQIRSGATTTPAPEYVRCLCNYLLTHQEPKASKKYEIRIVSNDADVIKQRLTQAEIYKSKHHHEDWVTIMTERTMSKQIPEADFARLVGQNTDDASGGDDAERAWVRRAMECITVREPNTGKIRVLCDDERSLMRQLYNQTVVILRSYEFPKSK